MVNCLLCPLSVGARVVIKRDFDAAQVWRALLSPDVNVFMAVPTIYAKLLQAHRQLFSHSSEAERVRQTLRSQIRLMVSGSAALPEVGAHNILHTRVRNKRRDFAFRSQC